MDQNHGFFAHALTIAAFICGACAFPILVACYIAVRILKRLWMKLLASKFPELTFVESDSIRTLLDTYRNHGIINALMVIKGTCEPSLIQQSLLEHVIEKKDRFGNLRFPKLRALLISCWGSYAWSTSSQFKLEEHIIQGSHKFRGRPINDQTNIQEYVSDVVSKYLPRNAPPWQIVIIPKIESNEPTYGIIIRVHHLLLDEQEVLNIGDFLLLKPEEQLLSSHCSQNTDETTDKEKKSKNPLTDILQTPKAIPSLYYRLCDSFSNRWNEFISEYDPIESPKLLQNRPGTFHCAAIFLITFAVTCKEFGKYISRNNSYPVNYVTEFITMFHSEALRRSLTPVNLLFSVFVTFNPISIISKIFQLFLWVNFAILLKIPIMVYNEYMALYSCLQHQYCMYPDTWVALLHNYLPLLYSAVKELLYIGKLIYMAPMTLMYEIFFRDKNSEEHQLQTMSTCGRKVIAWSEPVQRKWIQDISLRENVSETEVLLTMTTCCLKEYFQHAGFHTPNVVLATARTVMCDTLLSSVENNGSCNHKRSEMVYLGLPVGDSCTGHGTDELLAIEKEIKRVRERQGALYALSGLRSYIIQAVPSVLSRVALNYASRKYSVALTEVAEGRCDNGGLPRETRWGHTVSSLICWRPPQGNISMSLTIQSYAGAVTLGVMTDALMSPHHQAPARYWPSAARQFYTNILTE